jgi:N utilization substance protein B
MGKRTRARECALQMLYQWEITREPLESAISSFWRLRTTTDETRAMAERLARGTVSSAGRIDEAIAAVAKHWRLERIAAVDRTLLRLGAYELMLEPQTPSSVIIDEAVEMAKRFGEADSPAFVNGILDAIMRTARAGPDRTQARSPAGARRGR